MSRLPLRQPPLQTMMTLRTPTIRGKRRRRRRGRADHRSQDVKAVATSKIEVNLPELTGKDLSGFAENFGRFVRMTGQTHASGRVKCDLLLQCCKTKYLEKQVKQIVTMSATLAQVLVALERHYPSYETDLSNRKEIQNLAMLPNNPKAARITELLADLNHWVGRLDAFPWGAWPRDAALTRTSKQAGKALRSQGDQYARVM